MAAMPVGEERRIAAEFVDDEAARSAPHRPDRAPAFVPAICAMTPPRSMSPMRIDGSICRARKAHVGDIVGAQIDFGGAARALDEHEIGIARRDVAKLSSTAAQQLRLPALKFARRGRAEHAALRR